MKKMKTRTKLIGAVAALTVAVAMSAGTTFAWFTQNSTATVGSIEAEVKTAGSTSVYVAVGHKTSNTFKTSLDGNDLSGYIKGNLDAATIKDQNTSTGAIEYVTANGTTTVNEATASTAGYLKIPITIRTDAAETAVYLTENSEITKVDGMSTSTTVTMWGDGASQTYNSQTYNAGATLTAYAYNAARVGFTTLADSDGKPATESATESDYAVWSPNEASYDGGENDGTTTDRDVDQNGGSETYTNYWKNNLAGDYYDSVNGNAKGSYTKQVSYINYIAPEEGASSTAICTTKAVGNPESEEGYAFVYIYIWLEGTDGDCFNNILSQKISVSLTLTADTSLIASGGESE